MALSTNLFDQTGKKLGSKNLPKEVFDVEASSQLMTLAVRIHLSNKRQGTKSVKSRGQVDLTTKKIWRQKGTGRARHGSKKAPIFVGGGQAHGPTGSEQYSKKLTKKMRRKALLGSLSIKQQQKEINLIKNPGKLSGKTKDTKQLIQKIYPKNSSKILLILNRPEENVIKSTKNLKYITATQAKRLNIYEILNHKQILIDEDALGTLKTTYTDATKDTSSEKVTKPSPKKKTS